MSTQNEFQKCITSASYRTVLSVTVKWDAIFRNFVNLEALYKCKIRTVLSRIWVH